MSIVHRRRRTSGRSPYYDGPVSDHFDGVRFFEPAGAAPRGRGELLRWMINRRWGGTRAKWPAWAPSPHGDRPPTRVEGAAWRIAYVGHASWLVQTAGMNLLLDPIWSERASPFRRAGPKRVNDPGIAFADLPPIDVVLVSHAHYDHLDVASLSRLSATHRPRVITPLGNDTIIRNYDPSITTEAYDWDQRVNIGDGVAVTPVPTRHWSARNLSDRNMSLWASFVIEAPGGRIYFVADSGYGEGAYFRRARDRYGPFKLAILPIGAYEPRWFMRDHHMNPAEAVQALLDCGAETALASHHGTFQLTDEAIDAPLLALAEALAVAGISPERFSTLRPGQVCRIADGQGVHRVDAILEAAIANEPNDGWVREVLEFWFEQTESDEWFEKDPTFDATIRERFFDLHETLVVRGDSDLLADAQTALAAVVVLDQMSRNMFRDTPRAFASDSLALWVAKAAIARGFDVGLTKDQRMFLYLPFEHAEDGHAQARSVELMASLGDPECQKWAEAHKAIVDRFGRFPHRNPILGRISTPEEIEFLKAPDSQF